MIIVSQKVRYRRQASLCYEIAATLSGENCFPTNGIMDAGETVTVNFGLQNVGTSNTTNLVATLQATGGVLAPNGPQTAAFRCLTRAEVPALASSELGPASLLGDAGSRRRRRTSGRRPSL